MGTPWIITALNHSETPKARAGYAVIVVLFSLTVLTLIFGTSTARTLAHIEQTRTNSLLSQRHHESAGLAKVLIQIGNLDPANERSIAALDGMVLQPATGLVDLNTASPALLQLFLEGYGLSDAATREALERYRTWRREGRKLLRLSDFRRVTGLTAEMLPDLETYATVYSGRTGIAVEQAPTGLLRHLFGEFADREVVAERIDPGLISTVSAVNQHLMESGIPFGVVHLGGGVNGSRILELW